MAGPRRGRRSLAGLALATLAPALAAGLTAVGLGAATAPAARAQTQAQAPAPSPGCVTEAITTTCTFTYTGDVQNWRVPTGVRRVTFTVVGAAGGRAGGQPGGRGGGVTHTITVPWGKTPEYRLHVGGKGGSDSDPVPGRGGWNGGGNGAGVNNPHGGGGGGASEIRYGDTDVLMVGGGGGGAGSQVSLWVPQPDRRSPGAGGNGGGAGAGFPGGSVSWWWGVGATGGGQGTATEAGYGGQRSAGTLLEGCGAFTIAEPVDGSGGAGRMGGAGGYLRQLWTPYRCDNVRGWGGGGGGGWRAGGGGGAGVTAGAGGGGGSGYAPPGSGSSLGEPDSDGLIKITYVTPTSDWVALGGGTMTSAPTVAVRPAAGKLMPMHDVFYLNEFSAVIQRTVTEGVPSPVEINHGATLFPGSRVSAVWRSGGRLDLFGRGTESALWRKSFDGISWGAWQPITQAGTLTSDPSAVSVGPNVIDVFYRGVDQDLVQLPIFNQVPQKPLGRNGNLSTAPAAASAVPGRIDVVAGTNGLLHHWTYTPGVWTDNGVHAAAGTLTSAPAMTVDDPTSYLVEFRNQDNGRTSAWLTTDDGWVSHGAAPVPSPPGSAMGVLGAEPTGNVEYARGLNNTLMARVDHF